MPASTCSPDVLPVRAARLRAELGWLAGLLGDVRDLDIQLGRFDDWTEEMPGDHREALDELADLLSGQRADARRALLEGLDSRRYERLVSGLVAMLEQGPSRRSSVGRAPAVMSMPALINERHRAGRQGGPAGQAHGSRHRLPPPPHPLQAAPLLPRVRLRPVRRRTEGLRAPDDPPPGRAGLNAGRRSRLGASAGARAHRGGWLALAGRRSSRWAASPSGTGAKPSTS